MHSYLVKFDQAFAVLSNVIRKPVSRAPFLKKHLFSTSGCYSQPPPNKVVFISQSTDVFSNLALEAWLYKNWSFSRRQLLLLWRNSPCVVIGRHQNPFREANLAYLESAHVPLARRHSGGGAVYHDNGNLNCTFFCPRDSYNRRWNLELLCLTLKSSFGLDVQLNSRDDILLNNKLKVSGSAAKLGRTTAYHHCTLLVDTEHQQLSLTLQGDKDMESTATASVPSPVANLSSREHRVNVERVMHSVASRYLEASLPGQKSDPRANRLASHGLTLVNPQDDWFPGLGEMREELSSWEWLFGKTPRFTKRMTVSTPDWLSHVQGPSTITLVVQCQHGLVDSIAVENGSCTALPEVVVSELRRVVQGDLSEAVRGTPYSPQMPTVLDSLLRLQQPSVNMSTSDKLKL